MLNIIKRKITKYFKEKKQRDRNIKNIKKIINEHIAIQHFNQLSLNSDRLLTTQTKYDDHDIILSFTTYNKRIHDIHLVLESIANQTVKPNKVTLWLDEDEFCIDTIPIAVKNYINRGLEINFCANYRSYKKIIPTLIKYPNSHIITIDDDIIYPHDMIEQLVVEHNNNPNLIIGHRGHKIKFTGSSVSPYKQWEKNINDSHPSHDILLTGCGGIFYPFNSLDKEVTNIDNFMSLCPNADDIWLKLMALKANTKNKLVCTGQNYDNRFISINLSQDIGLNKSNVDHNHNDSQLKDTMEYYKMHF